MVHCRMLLISMILVCLLPQVLYVVYFCNKKQGLYNHTWLAWQCLHLALNAIAQPGMTMSGILMLYTACPAVKSMNEAVTTCRCICGSLAGCCQASWGGTWKGTACCRCCTSPPGSSPPLPQTSHSSSPLESLMWFSLAPTLMQCSRSGLTCSPTHVIDSPCECFRCRATLSFRSPI